VIPGFTTQDVIVLKPPRGGIGGDQEDKYCEANTGITDINISFFTGPTAHVRSIDFSCTRLADGSSRGRRRFGLAPFHIEYPQVCPGSEYATGLNIRYGKHLNAVGLICAALEPATPPIVMVGGGDVIAFDMEDNTNRPGHDYKNFPLEERKAEICRSACRNEPDSCRAWSYVRPGPLGPKPMCYLKKIKPAAIADACCVSGVEGTGDGPAVQEPGGMAPPTPGDITRLPDGGIAPDAASMPRGRIGEKYAKLGGTRGALGPPVDVEKAARHGGRCHAFRHGTICWHGEIGEAFAVWGLIHDKWLQFSRVDYGYPITDERTATDGRGRFNHFRAMHIQGRPEGSIFWSPETGAHAIYGLIRDAWAKQGWERGPLGYPKSDEYQDGKFRRVDFQRGHILWAPDTGIQIRQ
jgi:hypothetical protein